mmetsp:Transcript_7047/g.11769  ORF Transcript_7047/g.11769 Transcript_7047/m.11769 type:complete len:183 (-) Transcript_7047:227-775(-)
MGSGERAAAEGAMVVAEAETRRSTETAQAITPGIDGNATAGETAVLEEQDNILPVINLHVSADVDETKGSIMMLYEILPGPANRSYGIHVAKIAQFPESIIHHAEEIETALITLNMTSESSPEGISCGAGKAVSQEVASPPAAKRRRLDITQPGADNSDPDKEEDLLLCEIEKLVKQVREYG